MALTKQISNRALILSNTTAEVTTAQTIAPYYDFRVDGVLDLDLEESLDASRYIHAAQTLISAKVSVRVGGTSEYGITVKSYDSTGGNEVTHISVTGQTFTDNNSITTLSFAEPDVGAERTLVFSIVESTSNTPVEDFCLTLVSSTFADLDVIPNTSVIGETRRGDFTVAYFQGIMGVNWIEADGQSSVGTAYEAETGNSVVPSLSPDAEGNTVMIRVN